MRGIVYTTSEQKCKLDHWLAGYLKTPARFIAQQAVSLLPFQNESNPDGSFHQKRVAGGGQMMVIPKVQTMVSPNSCSPSDKDIEFHKANPRIANKIAHLMRDLAIDELPQIELVPILSFVGPRPHTEDSLNHFHNEINKHDTGLARDYTDMYSSPSEIRAGLTGPGQLLLTFSDERTGDILARAARKDIEYYYHTATAPKDVAIIAATPPALVASAITKHINRG